MLPAPRNKTERSQAGQHHGIGLGFGNGRERPLDYLLDRSHTLTAIAFLLGYSEVSVFNRAFKRWTGSTPLKYRNKTALRGVDSPQVANKMNCNSRGADP